MAGLPHKAALFFAAVLESKAQVVAWVAELPTRAGEGDVEGNLIDAAVQLASLRDEIMPLELAIAADPEPGSTIAPSRYGTCILACLSLSVPDQIGAHAVSPELSDIATGVALVASRSVERRSGRPPPDTARASGCWVTR